jgi:hypothetical protein
MIPADKRYILSVGYKPTGEEYPKQSLIDRKRMKSVIVWEDGITIPKKVQEKKALVKLHRGSFADTDHGMWIGTRHLIVYLTEGEYKEIWEKVNGDTREQGEEEG